MNSPRMGSGNVALFRLAPDGTPDWVATCPTADGAFFRAFTVDGRYLLVAKAEANSVSTLDLADSANPRLVVSVPSGGDGSRGIAVHSTGTVHVAHYAAGSVTSFALGADGGLTRPGGSVATGGNGAEAIVAQANSLYVANFNTGGPGSVSTFVLRSGNTPTLTGDPTPTGGSEPDVGSMVIRAVGGR
jgi:6-phosphogluconolactonase (cycloisomerase 2 family)